jgi:hypothetical protein
MTDELLQRLDSITGVDDPGAVAEVRDAAADEIRRLRDIIAKLAAINPWCSDDNGNSWCAVCESGFISFDLHHLPPEHTEDCGWRQAREYLGLPTAGWHPDDEVPS